MPLGASRSGLPDPRTGLPRIQSDPMPRRASQDATLSRSIGLVRRQLANDRRPWSARPAIVGAPPSVDALAGIDSGWIRRRSVLGDGLFGRMPRRASLGRGRAGWPPHRPGRPRTRPPTRRPLHGGGATLRRPHERRHRPHDAQRAVTELTRATGPIGTVPRRRIERPPSGPRHTRSAEVRTDRRSYPVPTVSMRQLLEAGIHFGHQTRRWNPKMRPFIFAERNGIHIIDLAQTVKRLDVALDAVREIGRPRRVGALRRHQEAGPGAHRPGGGPGRSAVGEQALARRHADELHHDQEAHRPARAARGAPAGRRLRAHPQEGSGQAHRGAEQARPARSAASAR